MCLKQQLQYEQLKQVDNEIEEIIDQKESIVESVNNPSNKHSFKILKKELL